MPPKTKITKEMILEAAFEIVRAEGSDKLTARSVAGRLNCSTQPILYHFSTIEEIRKHIYEKADRYHSEYIMPTGETQMNPLLEIGMRYIRFACEEKHLFQLLFMSGQFSGLKLNDLIASPELEGILQMLSVAAKIDREKAREVFLSLFITAHGCACLLAGNAMEYEEERFAQLLTRAMHSCMK